MQEQEQVSESPETKTTIASSSRFVCRTHLQHTSEENKPSLSNLSPCVGERQKQSFDVHYQAVLTSFVDPGSQIPKDINWQTLAPELIFQILNKFLPGLTLHVVKPKHFPWYLGHICSSWRAVFKSSPQFWSSLVIEIPYAQYINIERAMLLIEMAIQQSKNHPLTFQFKSDEKNITQLLRCHKLLEALMAQSTRWLNAYLYLPSSMASLLYAVKTRFPILRAFRLMITCYDTRNEDSPQFGDLFEDAPQVRHACIVDYTAWKLNWSSITTLHLHFADMVESELLGNFLQRIEHLEELYLESRGCTSYTPSRVTLPFLRCLGTSAMENLVLFEAPVLEELYIKPSGLTAEEYYEVVRELVGPLNHLKKLVLLLTDIDMAILIFLIFQYLPEVQNIDFYVQDLSVLKILPLCPSARHLETMTVGLALFHEVYHLREILDLLKFWSTQGNATTGFGRFEALKRFTLMLHKTEKGLRTPRIRMPELEDPSRIESEIIGLFEERGVQCSIKYTCWQRDYSDVAVPPFDIFWGQVAGYLL